MDQNHSEEPTVPIDVPAALEPAVREMMARRAGGAPAESLDYADSSTPPPRQRLTSLPQTIALALLALLWTWLLTYYVPGLKDMLADFKTELPAPTKMALRLSNSFVESYGFLWIRLLPVLVPFATVRLLPLEKMRPGTRLTILIVGTLLAAVISFAVVYMLMALPLLRLIQGMSGKN